MCMFRNCGPHKILGGKEDNPRKMSLLHIWFVISPKFYLKISDVLTTIAILRNEFFARTNIHTPTHTHNLTQTLKHII